MAEPDIVKRTTLVVRDAEAARWYDRVFGMTRALDTPSTLPGAPVPGRPA